MALEYRKVSKQNISKSFRGILRVSPNTSGQDVGFIGDYESIVSDSNGTGSALSLGKNSAHIKNLGASGEITLSGNTSITEGAFSINTDNNICDLNGVDINMSTKPVEGDILYYQNNEYSSQRLETIVLDIIKRNNISMIGHIMIWGSETIPDGWLLCDGRILNRSEYQGLFEVIGHAFSDPTQDNFNIQFRLPDFRGMFLRGLDKRQSRTLGSFEEGGVPNIWGYFTIDDQVSVNCEHTGAFTRVTQDGRYYDAESSLDNRKHGHERLHIDATYCSSVYKNGLQEVRPDNIAINFIIRY